MFTSALLLNAEPLAIANERRWKMITWSIQHPRIVQPHQSPRVNQVPRGYIQGTVCFCALACRLLRTCSQVGAQKLLSAGMVNIVSFLSNSGYWGLSSIIDRHSITISLTVTERHCCWLLPADPLLSRIGSRPQVAGWAVILHADGWSTGPK